MTQLNALSDQQIIITSLTANGSEIQVNPETEWLKIHLRCGDIVLKVIDGGANSKYCHVERMYC